MRIALAIFLLAGVFASITGATTEDCLGEFIGFSGPGARQGSLPAGGQQIIIHERNFHHDNAYELTFFGFNREIQAFKFNQWKCTFIEGEVFAGAWTSEAFYSGNSAYWFEIRAGDGPGSYQFVANDSVVEVGEEN